MKLRPLTSDIEIEDAIEYFESAYSVGCTYNSETGAVSYSKVPHQLYRNIRRLKRSRPDYRAGKVKVYTREEIEEYERAKS